jgi:hypothetical protein
MSQFSSRESVELIGLLLNIWVGDGLVSSVDGGRLNRVCSVFIVFLVVFLVC